MNFQPGDRIHLTTTRQTGTFIRQSEGAKNYVYVQLDKGSAKMCLLSIVEPGPSADAVMQIWWAMGAFCAALADYVAL